MVLTVTASTTVLFDRFGSPFTLMLALRLKVPSGALLEIGSVNNTAAAEVVVLVDAGSLAMLQVTVVKPVLAFADELQLAPVAMIGGVLPFLKLMTPAMANGLLPTTLVGNDWVMVTLVAVVVVLRFAPQLK